MAAKGGQREARVCRAERAANRRVLTRNGTGAVITHCARLLGKTYRHCINLYWAGSLGKGITRREGMAWWARNTPECNHSATPLALWGKPRNSIALPAGKALSALAS